MLKYFIEHNCTDRATDSFVVLYADDLTGAGDTAGKDDSHWASQLPNIKAAFKYRTWLSGCRRVPTRSFRED